MKTLNTLFAIFASLILSAIMASADPNTLTVPLSQTFTPKVAHFEAIANMTDGIRVGMTPSQVAAIASKNNFGPPSVTKKSVEVHYRGYDAKSAPFESKATYEFREKKVKIRADFYFTSPATGNALYRFKITADYNKIRNKPYISDTVVGYEKWFGPATENDNSNDAFWLFGTHLLKKCPSDYCYTQSDLMSLFNGVESNITVQFQHGQFFTPGCCHKPGYKINVINLTYINFLEESDDLAQSTLQLQNAVLKVINKQANIEKSLAENTNNVLSVSGFVTTHVLVGQCDAGIQNDILAKTFPVGGETSLSATHVSNKLFYKMIAKYRFGSITLDGKKYNIRVAASAAPPGTDQADVDIEPVQSVGDGSETIYFSRKLVSGKIAIIEDGKTQFSQTSDFLFKHATFRVKIIPSDMTGIPKNATISIDGKTYCPPGGPPLPTDFTREPAPQPQPIYVAPRSGLHGVYFSSGNQNFAMKFLSDHDLLIGNRSGNGGNGKVTKATYDISGRRITINDEHGSVDFFFNPDGCYIGGHGVSFCKIPDPKLTGVYATTPGIYPVGILTFGPKSTFTLSTQHAMAHGTYQVQKRELNLTFIGTGSGTQTFTIFPSGCILGTFGPGQVMFCKRT